MDKLEQLEKRLEKLRIDISSLIPFDARDIKDSQIDYQTFINVRCLIQQLEKQMINIDRWRGHTSGGFPLVAESVKGALVNTSIRLIGEAERVLESLKKSKALF